MAAKVARYDQSDLPARHKAALRLADAMMTHPSTIDTALRAELRRHFDERELLDLTLEVMKWNHQKIKVALGIDEPVRADGELTEFRVAEDGSIHY